MLSPERYQSSLHAFGKMAEAGFEVDGPTRHLLLSEQLATQKALEALGATRNTPPSELPRINEILPPTIKFPPRRRKEIEIAGIPRSGKTTFLSGLDSKRFKIIFEKYLAAKKLLDSTDEQPLNWYELVAVFGHGMAAEEYLRIPSTLKKPIIIERGQFDVVPFTQANFLLGRIEGEGYWTIVRFFQMPLSFTPNQTESQKALILCLIPPQTSFERRDKTGRFMNLEFLGALYEQYLRLHHQLITGYRPFYYVCLDLSNGGLEENQKIMQKTLSEIVIRMKA